MFKEESPKEKFRRYYSCYLLLSKFLGMEFHSERMESCSIFTVKTIAKISQTYLFVISTHFYPLSYSTYQRNIFYFPIYHVEKILEHVFVRYKVYFYEINYILLSTPYIPQINFRLFSLGRNFFSAILERE